MSVTLTDRDSGTIVLTVAASSPGEVTYAVSGGVLSDFRTGRARHSNQGVVTKNSRHNFQLGRSKLNPQGYLKTMTADITLSVPNDGTFTADDIDDLVTAATSYFNSEATTQDFVIGVSRS